MKPSSPDNDEEQDNKGNLYAILSMFFEVAHAHVVRVNIIREEAYENIIHFGDANAAGSGVYNYVQPPNKKRCSI